MLGGVKSMKGEKQMIYKNITFKADPFSYDLEFDDREFESDSHMKNWLIRVTVNQCKMLFRSPWSKMEDIGEYADTLEFEEESHLDLFQAVMNLDKKYRVPILLFYYENYSTTEIASILGIPEKTVSTRLFLSLIHI